MIEIRVGDHVKQWFQPDEDAMVVEAIRIHRNLNTCVVIGRRLSNQRILAIPQTTSMVVVFRPLSDDEMFRISEGLCRDHTTGCLSCGAQWDYGRPDGSGTLLHREDCRYLLTRHHDRREP
jgi:hypothetical protein